VLGDRGEVVVRAISMDMITLGRRRVPWKDRVKRQDLVGELTSPSALTSTRAEAVAGGETKPHRPRVASRELTARQSMINYTGQKWIRTTRAIDTS